MSNNSTKLALEVNKLTGGHKRMAFVLAEEIRGLANDFGILRLGFLTLTFAENITDIREAQRRFNSLNTHILRHRYKRCIGVWERQKRGAVHFHLVVVLDADIRTGFRFEDLDKPRHLRYRSAGDTLRNEWAFWRETAPKYGFGRTELLPVRSNADGIAYYVGKYVAKHVSERSISDKGARVVRFLGFRPGERKACARFSWNNTNGWLWRTKLKTWASKHGFQNSEQIRAWVGLFFGQDKASRWAYFLQDEIIRTDITEAVCTWPNCDLALREFHNSAIREARCRCAIALQQKRSTNDSSESNPQGGLDKAP